MPKKNLLKTTTKDRIVYEVKTTQGVRQVDATTTAELVTALTPLLNLADPYSVKAAAHLVHMERAAVQGSGWSVRRLGVLTFQPDQPEKAQSVSGRAEAQQTAVEPDHIPEQSAVLASVELSDQSQPELLA